MFPSIETRLQSQLLDRQKKLQIALSGAAHREHLAHLLREVDAALDKLNNGTYGLCETCHESVEEDRLLANPLCRNCLDHLSESERKALENDLDLAYQIQSALLPKRSFVAEGWTIARHYEAAGPVSGDYCDLILAPNEPGAVYFLLGDVSGKGVSASILMAHLHAIFRSLVLLNLPVNQLVERANRVFSEGTLSTHYATLVCAKATAVGDIEVCNAGHCPPLFLHNGVVKRVAATGLPLGLFAESEFDVEKIEVRSGDTFLLYTDGLTESRDSSDREYGEERLISFVSVKRGLLPQELVSACLNDLAAFRADRPKTDDLTILAFHRQ